MPCHVLAQTLTFSIVENLGEESANLQENRKQFRKAQHVQSHTYRWGQTSQYLCHIILIRAVVAPDVRRDFKLGLQKALLTIWGAEAVGVVVRSSPFIKIIIKKSLISSVLWNWNRELWSVLEFSAEFGYLSRCVPMHDEWEWIKLEQQSVYKACVRNSHPGCQSCTWVHLSGSWPRVHDKGN